MERVLVVTPVYSTQENGRQRLLFDTVNCVLNQSHGNTLYVVVDDGSTDDTSQLLDRISLSYPIDVLHQGNKGSSEAINAGVRYGVKKYNPDFIAVCHSDDMFFPDSLERRVLASLDTGASLVYSDMVVLDDINHNAELVGARDYTNGKDLYQGLLWHRYIPYPTLLWGRDLFESVGGYDPLITSAEDWDIALRSAKELARRDHMAAVIHRPTVVYRNHEHNLGRQNILDGTKWRCYKRILSKHFSGLPYYSSIGKEGYLVFRTRLKMFLSEYLPVPAYNFLRFVRNQIKGKPKKRLDYYQVFREVKSSSPNLVTI
jgi:glycosyltransferase involved in cell wall biosynthesis